VTEQMTEQMTADLGEMLLTKIYAEVNYDEIEDEYGLVVAGYFFDHRGEYPADAYDEVYDWVTARL